MPVDTIFKLLFSHARGAMRMRRAARDTKVDADAIHQQNGLNLSVWVRKAGGTVVGQLGKLRPIGNRPTAAFTPGSGGNQPPRRLPACPTLRQRLHSYVVHQRGTRLHPVPSVPAANLRFHELQPVCQRCPAAPDAPQDYLIAPALGSTRSRQAASNWGSVTVVVPTELMAMAAASPANSMASPYDAPAGLRRHRRGGHV